MATDSDLILTIEENDDVPMVAESSDSDEDVSISMHLFQLFS